MSTHNIQFRDKIRKFLQVFVFLSCWKNLVGTKNEFELAMVNEPSVFELSRFDCMPQQTVQTQTIVSFWRKTAHNAG